MNFIIVLQNKGYEYCRYIVQLASRKPVVATKFLKAAMRTGTKKDPCMNMGMNMEVKDLLTTQDGSPARDTPLHILSKRNLDPESFTQLFTELEIVLGDLMERNAFNETPLHVAAREDVNSFIEAGQRPRTTPGN